MPATPQTEAPPASSQPPPAKKASDKQVESSTAAAPIKPPATPPRNAAPIPQKKKKKRRSARVLEHDPIIAPGFGTAKDLKKLTAELAAAAASGAASSPRSLPYEAVLAMMRCRGRGIQSLQKDDGKEASPQAVGGSAKVEAASAPDATTLWAEESTQQTPEGVAATETSTTFQKDSSMDVDDSTVTRVYHLEDETETPPRKKSKTVVGGILVQAGTLDAASVGRSKIKDLHAAAYHLATPTRIVLPSVTIQTVMTHCSAAHSIAIDTAGVAYGWGRNEAGQLGLHNDNDPHASPANVIFPTKLDGLAGPCHAAAVGKSHSLFWLQDGTLWAVGANKAGQCGVRTFTDVPQYRKCFLPDEFELQQIACGEDFTVAVTKTGHVYTTGSSEFGQLGNGSTGEYFVTANKLAFENCNLLTRRDTFCHAPTEKLHVNNEKAKVVPLDEDVRIGQVAAGKHHVIAVEAASNRPSRVFSWGCGNYGDLGHGIQADEYFPRLIGVLNKNPAITAKDPPVPAAGATCSLLRMGNGHVYYWGKHRSVGEATMRPQLVDVLANNGHVVRHVAAGGQTVVCSTAGAQTVAWGQGPHGELGLEKAKSSAKPTFVSALDKCLVTDIACGYGHTLYVVQNQDEEDKKAVAQLTEITEDDVQELVNQQQKK